MFEPWSCERMNVAFLGASRGMGRALARLMAERGAGLVLLGRNIEQLEHSARDLELRGALRPVGVQHCDLEDPTTFEPALVGALEHLGGLDTVVVTAGLFGTQDELEADLEHARRVLEVNFTHTIVFCEQVRTLLLERGGGTLCVFSSVAGDRGRKPVGLYGASKAGLSHYLESLDHKYRAEGLKTICIKPGFVKTAMTHGLKPPPFAGEPEQVARRVLAAIERGTPEVYAPAIWGAIMAIIRRLPRAVMRRVNF
ncbi:MAG: SDR family NAD(P)-dependent oxidoreductase [Myxococcota bacterium]